VTSAKTKTDFSKDISLRALLGLADDGDVDWGKVRAIQFRGLERNALVKTVGTLICALLVMQFGLQVANPFVVLGWSVVIAALYIFAHLKLKSLALWDRKQLDRRDFSVSYMLTFFGALLWSLPMPYAAFVGDPAFLIWTFAATLCLMVGSSIFLSTIPLGTIVFVVLTGISAAGSFFYAGFIHLSAAAIAITAMLIVAAVTLARNFVAGQIAYENICEKDEVVSLLLREFEDSGADWLWQIDTARCLIHASPRFARALRREPEDVNGKPFLQMVAGECWETGRFPPALHDLAERLKQRESFSNLMVPVYIDGEQRWWELSASPKLDEAGVFQGFRGVGSDVTEQRESANKIAQMARYDTLTGLPNRLYLTESLSKAMEDAGQWNGRYGFMMIDLDRFKAVNDTLGHPVGDRLLARVSDRLQSIMTNNEICGRLGGDEFAIVIRDASDSEYVDRFAKQIIDTLSRPYEVDQHTLYIGASVGVAVGPRDGRTVEMLMRSADLALYRSKDQGGGAFNNYEPKLHVHAEERRIMEIALRKALENRELSLNYQPVVSADTGGLTGFEALLRWNHPEFGAVSPAKFIPIAEDARLIVPIGAWVMREACKEAMNWPETVKVAVNVSADQLHDPGFLKNVREALSISGLSANRLEIEVTESLFMQDGTGATKVLDQVIDMGIHLSLDDFGTGYSSLGYLRKTRFSTIKVDRSFVVGAAKKIPESLAIIRAVVAMADALGMSTTAEGAETEDEVRMIQKLGCRKIQGYYFGRPMNARDTSALFRKLDQEPQAHDFRAA
jgi:diguanylate cyclase (GGDEF)-like protein